MLTLCGTPDFTIYYIYICESGDYICGLMTLVYLPGLVLTALSRTYFIVSVLDLFIQYWRSDKCI